MLIAELKTRFNMTEPIFSIEIKDLFPQFTEAYLFRLIKDALNSGELVKFSQGVYYMPEKTDFGLSTIIADEVVEKRYIGKGKDICGVYSGIKLLNTFSATTQVPNVIEIVTNNETTRKRIIEIDGRKFILRKSRCEITPENVDAYTVLQLFNDLGNDFEINDRAKEKLIGYMRKFNINKKSLLELSKQFPAKALKNLVCSEVLNDIA